MLNSKNIEPNRAWFLFKLYSKPIIERSLDNFEEYLEITEKAFDNKLNYSRIKAKKIPKKFLQYYIIFPNILRYSFFISCFSFFEHQLDTICDGLQSRYKYPINLGDLKDKGISRAQIYFKKVINVKFPDETKCWQKIREYNKIRNKIVHNGGRFKKTEFTELQNKNHIKLDFTNRIVLNKEFCGEVIATMREFFTHLFSILNID